MQKFHRSLIGLLVILLLLASLTILLETYTPSVQAQDVTQNQTFTPPPDDGSIIAVMVIYTPAAQIDAGGKEAIENQISAAIIEINEIFERSQVVPRLQLVYKGEVSYIESGSLGDDNNRLRSTNDGHMDEIHALRDTYYADLVSLIVENDTGTSCGEGVKTNNRPESARNAFSTVKLRCVSAPNYALAHEMGHTLGLSHNREEGDPPGAFTYGYGYRDPIGGFRDVMSYDCPRPQRCPIIPYFSNPNIMYNGRPLGIPDLADNARALNNIAYTAANWRSQDMTNPIGSILTPQNGTVSTTPFFNLTAEASDNVGGSGVFGVDFYVGYGGTWRRICTDMTAPYSCSWVARNIPNQSLNFKVDIIDYAGNILVQAGGSQRVNLNTNIIVEEVFLPLVRR